MSCGKIVDRRSLVVTVTTALLLELTAVNAPFTFISTLSDNL